MLFWIITKANQITRHNWNCLHILWSEKFSWKCFVTSFMNLSIKVLCFFKYCFEFVASWPAALKKHGSAFYIASRSQFFLSPLRSELCCFCCLLSVDSLPFSPSLCPATTCNCNWSRAFCFSLINSSLRSDEWESSVMYRKC